MSLSVSEIILKNLINDGEYSARVLPFLKPEYFDRKEERVLFNHVQDYIEKYQATPTFESVFISLSEDRSINEKESETIDEILKGIREDKGQSKSDWLVDTTEKFCQEKALYNAITDSISIMNGDNKKLDKGAIPDLLKDALSVTFDASLGHDYILDAEKRYEYYHRVESKIPFDIEYLNKITKGGFAKKTFNVFMAGTGVGKTALMCHMAGANLRMGKNVLYFTLEIAEEEISKRIDANNMDITLDEVLALPKSAFTSKINKIKSSPIGRLIVKEYPMGAAHVGHFRTFLNELRLKQNFKPDIIYIDYLNLCQSLRFKGNNANSYGYIKAITEEIRGLAQELDICIVSATQTNRNGINNSDVSMTDVSDSIGAVFGLDFFAVLIATEDMIERGHMLLKQLKNRYSDMNQLMKFFIGFDRTKMKIYNLDKPTDGINSSGGNDDDPPVMNKSRFNDDESAGTKKKFNNFQF